MDENKIKVVKDVFVLPYESAVILYAPLAGTILKTSPGVVNFLKEVKNGRDPNEIDNDLTSKLTELGILTTKNNHSLDNRPKEGYLPTAVTLLPTYDCNLKCVYCYSCAGEDVTPTMKPEVAKASIDFIIENSKKLKTNRAGLSFHGGGEPFLEKNMPLVKYAISYFRERCKEEGIKGEITAVSNGTFTENTLNYLMENLDRISISMDGPKDIQDLQRPNRGENSGSSYDRVINTIKRLEDSKLPYNLRATVTADSVGRMTEIYEFFRSISKKGNFHLEPLFECGRCESTQKKAPENKDFAENFLKTKKLAKTYKQNLSNSASNIERISETFCGACGYNFFITPLGDITTCLESCRKTQDSAVDFFIGSFIEEKNKFKIDEDKIMQLRERKVSNMPHCQNCFAKYNCSGDCLSKVRATGENLLDASKNERCDSTRRILLEDIIEITKQAEVIKIENKKKS